MGLPERVLETKPEEREQDQPVLLDEKALFPRKPLPYKEVDFIGADGTEGKVLLQALTMREMDEINHIQDQPIRDGRGNVIEEANTLGYEAKIVARALRRPDRTRLAGEHWLALSEQIENQWLPGTIRAVKHEVLMLSGYGLFSRAIQKKD